MTVEPKDAIRAIETNLEGFLLEFCRTPESRVLRTREYTQVLTAQSLGMFNLVVGAMLPADQAVLRVEEISRRFSALDMPACWWITPSTLPAQLDRMLMRAGWVQSNAWRGMVRELEGLPAIGETLPGVRIAASSDPTDVAEWLDVFRRGFGTTERLQHALSEAWKGRVLPFTLYLARREGTGVGTGLVFRTGTVAGVYCVGTLPEARRQGIATRLMRTVLEDAARQGCRHAIVQSTEMGMSLYRRLGFRVAGRFRMFDRSPD